jgi:hypothetical protein
MSAETREQRLRRAREKVRAELGEEYFARFESDLRAMLDGLSPGACDALRAHDAPPVRLTNPLDLDELEARYRQVAGDGGGPPLAS